MLALVIYICGMVTGYMLVILLTKLKLTREYAELQILKQIVKDDLQKCRLDIEIFKQNAENKLKALFPTP